MEYADVRAGQLGLNESAVPAQDSSLIGNQSLETQEAQGKPWPLGLSIEYANRYMQAAFCTWYCESPLTQPSPVLIVSYRWRDIWAA